MAHRTLKNGFEELVERLNRFPQGAPPSETLFAILKMLFSEKEAGLVALLPIRPFTVETASKAWKMERVAALSLLEELSSRAILLDVGSEGSEGSTYVLPPPMAGFFEFALMRLRTDIDQKVLGELYHQYLNVEEDFIRELMGRGETQLGRAFVQEPMLSSEDALHVLDYEKASEVIESATHMGVGLCYCRHKAAHAGSNCDAPLDICMTFNGAAKSLIKHGYARSVEKSEGLELLQQAYEHNLVQFGENVREGVSFVCNCCGCCCEAMVAARKFASLRPVHTTNFMPGIEDSSCTGCGKCVKLCPVEALSLVSVSDSQRKKARLDEERCLGCGICVRNCPRKSLSLMPRKERILTPINSAHRVVLMAIERGKLQELIFDNQVLHSHRAMAAVLGVILKLPPIKQALASKQMRSRYLEKLLAGMKI
ncbi:MAG TPA: 4Fe-4S dicluster domain-containing protein [Chroococcales cyanobacterium]|jgi:Pyruvate/2-oxoacid:ferredoxin oxidoreductase delta subunit